MESSRAALAFVKRDQWRAVIESGGAYVDDLKELVDIVTPKYIVPIHTKEPDRYEATFAPIEVRKRGKGQEYPVSSSSHALNAALLFRKDN